MVCDEVYFNPFDNSKQWYTPYEEMKEIIVRLNTYILTRVKIKSTKYVALPSRASNKLSGDTIRLDTVSVRDNTHDEIMETIFQGKNYITMN